jgi:hypothetical protein
VEEIKVCRHMLFVVVSLIGYLTVFGGRGFDNVENTTFPRSSI